MDHNVSRIIVETVPVSMKKKKFQWRENNFPGYF